MTEALSFEEAEAWWDWLAAHHDTAAEVWVLYHKKGSGRASIDWGEAVVEALCWGWIDGVRKSVDATRWQQRFTPRRAGSAWSKINRAHAERLIVEGRMQAAGLRQVEIARQNGMWEQTYSGGKGAEIPADFLDAVAAAGAVAQAGFAALDGRSRFAIYYRLTTVKRAETRAKRLAEFVAKLARGEAVI